MGRSLIAGESRPRLPVAVAGALLLWTSGWYGGGHFTGLFWLAAVGSAVAVALPRSAPGTARFAIWGGLGVMLACLVANLERIMPPDLHPELAQAYQFDRLATVAFALGITALFFRPSSVTVTVVTAAVLPLTMMALSRSPLPPSRHRDAAIVWGTLALAALLHQSHRWTQPRPGGPTPPGGGRDVAVRMAIVLAVLAVAFAITSPIERGARAARARVFDLLSHLNTDSSAPGRTSGHLSLRSPPVDFAGRVRALMVISAPVAPGYLREEVYTTYDGGEWTAARHGEQPLTPRPPPGADAGGNRQYILDVASNRPVDAWRCQVLEPEALAGYCLPGRTVALQTGGSVPVADTNGAVMPPPEERLPDRFCVFVARAVEPAYPLPAALPGGAYRAVPASLAAPVSNWVAACAGLSSARTAEDAGEAIAAYFRAHFAYRLGVTVPPHTDRLVSFMERREGHCTLFASAAALMLRARGIPTRVVGGFLCDESNPLNDTWVVRERDAHAWVEAWDAAAGRWFLVEATPPDGRPTAYAPVGALRHLREWFATGWRKLVTVVRQTSFLALLAAAGIAFYTFVQHWLATPAGLALLLVLVGFRVWRRWRRRRAMPEDERLRNELVRSMQRRERRAVPSHLRRRPNESWADWVARVTPDLAPDRTAALTRTVDAYQALRYRATLDREAAHNWLVPAHAERNA